MKNKTLYFIYYSLFSVSLFFFAASLWVLFSSLRMIPIIILSALGAIFSFAKMKKVAKKEQMIKDVFSLCTWTVAVIVANIYIEFAYGSSGLEATKYMTDWKVILLFVGVIIINKLFGLFYTKGNTDE